MGDCDKHNEDEYLLFKFIDFLNNLDDENFLKIEKE